MINLGKILPTYPFTSGQVNPNTNPEAQRHTKTMIRDSSRSRLRGKVCGFPPVCVAGFSGTGRTCVKMCRGY